MSAASAMLANQWFKDHFESEQLLAPPVHAATLDYRSFLEPDLDAEIHLTASRNGEAHGIAAWFDATLAGGFTFSCAPGQDRVYGQAMFAWPHAVSMKTGDRIAVRLQARFTVSEYFWTWRTQVSREGSVLVTFDQSDFHGQFLSPRRLRRSSPAHIPELTKQGEADRLILDLFARQVSVGAVADALLAAYPDSYRDQREALAHVGELSLRYSR
jgi:hypothetical protein